MDSFAEFDVDDDDEDGVVDSVEDVIEKNDDFVDFGEDQIISTGPDDLKGADKGRKFAEKPQGGLKFKEVPKHLRQHWRSYYIEGFVVAFLFLYILNYFVGSSKNSQIADIWVKENLDFLLTQFHDIGGVTEENAAQGLSPVWIHEGNNSYGLWCTGRKGIEGMYIEVRLEPRHDLISVIRNRLNKKRLQCDDTVIFSVYYDEDECQNTDPCIFVIGRMKSVPEIWRCYDDLRTFCPKGIKDRSNIISGTTGCAESVEMFSSVFDAKVKAAFEKKDGYSLDYCHVTDNYIDIYYDQESSEPPSQKCTKVAVVSQLLAKDVDSFGSVQFTKGVMVLAERVKKLALSKEAKSACEKRRIRAREEEQKRAHKQRQEMAAEKAEQRRRDMNKKIMEEEDVDKQRKLHESQLKKDERKRMKRLQKGKVMKMH